MFAIIVCFLSIYNARFDIIHASTNINMVGYTQPCTRSYWTIRRRLILQLLFNLTQYLLLLFTDADREPFLGHLCLRTRYFSKLSRFSIDF